MSELQSYRDPSLVPPDVADEMTPRECFDCCVHAEACVRARGLDEDYDHYDGDVASTLLGCGECPLHDDGDAYRLKVQRLKSTLSHVAGIVRTAEGMLEVNLMSCEVLQRLRECGIDVEDGR